MCKLYSVLVVAAALAGSGCKLTLVTPAEGGLISQSGAYSCDASQSCTIDVTDSFFHETFVAWPQDGFVFSRWRQRDRGLCGGSALPCVLSTEGFDQNDTLLALLEDPSEEFFLEPAFSVPRQTDEITLSGERTLSGFGNTWELNFYRNLTYACGLSGNYTFLVVEPANSPGAEAPLWVYLHGGGVGYFASPGDYRSINNNANAWNREETFDDLVDRQLLARVFTQAGVLKDATITRRIEEGYRLLIVSMCDHDLYSGIGTTYPNNPGAQTNGLQATMAAVDFTVEHFPTSHVIAHGTSAGSVGVFSLASAYALEDVYLTAVVADSYIVSPRLEPLFDSLAGVEGFPFAETFDINGAVDKIGFYIDLAKGADPETRIDAGFDEVPVLFTGGDADQFCGGLPNMEAIPEALANGLGNCDYLYDGIRQAISGQLDSPHQVTLVPGAGHTPTTSSPLASDVVDDFVQAVLAADPDFPFQ
ncbi:MAG: hypothetical protein AAGA91_18120 [Pseudomonadota bacterium]